MHLVTTVVDVSVSVDPRSCVAVATVQQTAVGAVSAGVAR